MRILHVIGGIMKAAGTSVFCVEIADGLKKAGYEVAIAVRNPQRMDAYPSRFKVPLIYISDVKEALYYHKWDIVHLHGLWEKELYQISRYAHKVGVKVVWSPHGTLTPWAMRFKRFKKALFWWCFMRREVNRAELLHVTAESEVGDMHRNGLSSPKIIVPLGVRTSLSDVELDRIKSSIQNAKNRIFLFVSRLQKKKGLLNLVEAWYKLKKENAELIHGWKIVIAGPDQENHRFEVSNVAKIYDVIDDFEFLDPVYGSDKDKLYAQASVFVLPTFSENFGSVVIEALSNKTPVITTKGAPWYELEEQNAGWWIEIGVEPLKKALKNAILLDDSERLQMGERGMQLVAERYEWNAITKKMILGYKSIL